MKEKHDSGRTLRIAYRVLSAGVCLALIAVLLTVVSMAGELLTQVQAVFHLP